MGKTAPVIPAEASEARKWATFATSSCVARRRRAVSLASAASASCGAGPPARWRASTPAEERLGRDGAGGERVDADAAGAEVEGRRADDADDGVLGGGVEHLLGVRLVAVDRGHGDGRPAPRGGERVGEGADGGRHTPDVDGHHALPFGGVEVRHAAPGRHEARVRHDDVDGARGRAASAVEAALRVGVGEVERFGAPVAPGGPGSAARQVHRDDGGPCPSRRSAMARPRPARRR